MYSFHDDGDDDDDHDHDHDHDLIGYYGYNPSMVYGLAEVSWIC